MTPPSNLLRLLTSIVGIYLLLLSGIRLAFYFVFHNAADPLPFEVLTQALYLGLKFDLRLSLLIVLPLFLTTIVDPKSLSGALKGWAYYLILLVVIVTLYYLFNDFPGLGYIIGKWKRLVTLLLLPLPLLLLAHCHPLRSRRWGGIWYGYLVVATVLVTLIYVFDFGHYAYLKQRIDISVLRFLENPEISAQMVWESYPVVWITVAVTLFLSAFALLLRNLMRRFAATGARGPSAPWRTMGTTLSVECVVAGIYGKVGSYPLRWSDAYFSSHSFSATLSLNPLLYFADSYFNGGIDYDRDEVERLYPEMANYLGAEADTETLNFRRPVEPSPIVEGQPNIVVIILESFASYKSGLSGNPLPTTPHFDAIAREGIYFDHFFTPHTGTARSVFAFTTGIPDVQIGDTSSRNPSIVNQHMLINAFADYQKLYFLGGSASWRNIRTLLSNNIDAIEIYEEGSYRSPRVDVWGISDLDLFREAHRVLDDRQSPFFAIIQTSGNHRPYTIPEDNGGFVPLAPDKDVTRYGFESAKEFNSYRFMDHSIGRFMELAKQGGYFDNTLFVLFGDHGISGYTGDHTPKHESQLGLGSYRVPLVFYGPGLIQGARTVHTPASEVDLLTTLLSATGHDHTNTTFGRNLLSADRLTQQRYAFTIHHAAIPTIGLIGTDHYFRMRADGSDQNLFRLGTQDPRHNHAKSEPNRAKQMERLTRSYYESARYIMNHNPPLSGE